MALSVKQAEAEWPREEYDVTHGEFRVGRLSYVTSESRWCWTMSGVAEGPDDLLRAGVAVTLPEAKAQIDNQWARWLAYANLVQASEPDHTSRRRTLK